MAGPFDYFVIYAEMRTGSNFLEASLNQFADLTCHGEVFNPSCVGHHKADALFGITLEAREADPLSLIAVLRGNTDGLAGFRLFHDHDARVLRHSLADTRCGKIILTRNPLQSYVSRLIVAQTGQWRLNDAKHQRKAQVSFELTDFQTYLAQRAAFQQELSHALQVSGQTGFYVDYDDLTDVGVLNGLAQFLGSAQTIKSEAKSVKKQNPEELTDKVSNYDQMVEALGKLDTFGLSSSAYFEPRRGPSVPGFKAAAAAPLLHMPLRGGPVAAMDQWMAALDGVPVQELLGGFTQGDLRKWKLAHPGFQAFSVLRHPLERAHEVFCRHILPADDPDFGEIRQVLRNKYKLPLPKQSPDSHYDRQSHQHGFRAFLTFLKGNLVGQTSIRIDPAWATQSALLEGMAGIGLPHHLLHEGDLHEDLPRLAQRIGAKDVPFVPTPQAGPFTLADIYDPDIEALAQHIYRRDYIGLGFGLWKTP